MPRTGWVGLGALVIALTCQGSARGQTTHQHKDSGNYVVKRAHTHIESIRDSATTVVIRTLLEVEQMRRPAGSRTHSGENSGILRSLLGSTHSHTGSALPSRVVRERWSVMKGPTTSARSVMIVRRGLSTAYYLFLRITNAETGVRLVVDRRTRDRRGTNHEDAGAPERRNGEGRGKPPASWFEEGFIVALAATSRSVRAWMSAEA